VNILALIGQFTQLLTIGIIVIVILFTIYLVMRTLSAYGDKEEYIGSKSNIPSRDVRQKQSLEISVGRRVVGFLLLAIVGYSVVGLFIPEKLFSPIKDKVRKEYALDYFYSGTTSSMPSMKTIGKRRVFTELNFHIDYQLSRKAEGWFWQDSAEIIKQKKSELDQMMVRLDLESSRSLFNDLWKIQPLKNVTLNYLGSPEISESVNDRIIRNTGATKILYNYILEDGSGKKIGGTNKPVEIKSPEPLAESGNSYSVKIPLSHLSQETSTATVTYSFSYTVTYSTTVLAKITSPDALLEMQIKADCDFEYNVGVQKEILEGSHSINGLHKQFEDKVHKAVIAMVEGYEDIIATSVVYGLQGELSEADQVFLQSTNTKHTPYEKLENLLFTRLRALLSNDKEVTVNYIKVKVNGITATIAPVN